MSKEEQKRLVIIDYTSLLYSASYNTASDEEKVDNFKAYKETVDFYTETILKDTQADFYITVGDGFTSFRKELYPSTKANRTAKSTMRFLKEIKEYAYEKWNVIVDEVLEADDICLMLHNEFSKKQYNLEVIIASKDSDLRQYPATFYNYGWRRDLFKKTNGNPSEQQTQKALKAAYEYITEEQAEFNLWKSVLIKGHNNKQHYLVGCGEKTADAYLSQVKPWELTTHVLHAFVQGIQKDGDTIKRGVKGLGFYKGIIEFGKSVEQSYLLTTVEEAWQVDSLFDPVHVKLQEVAWPEEEEEEVFEVDDYSDIEPDNL